MRVISRVGGGVESRSARASLDSLRLRRARIATKFNMTVTESLGVLWRGFEGTYGTIGSYAAIQRAFLYIGLLALPGGAIIGERLSCSSRSASIRCTLSFELPL